MVWCFALRQQISNYINCTLWYVHKWICTYVYIFTVLTSKPIAITYNYISLHIAIKLELLFEMRCFPLWYHENRVCLSARPAPNATFKQFLLNFDFETPNQTPLETNMDTQNSHIWKEVHLKKTSFLVSMLNFGGVTSLETTCPSDTSSSNASKPEKDLKPSNISPPSVGLASQLLSCPKLQIIPLIWLNPQLLPKKSKNLLRMTKHPSTYIVTATKKKNEFCNCHWFFCTLATDKKISTPRALELPFGFPPPTRHRHLSAKISKATSNATTSMVRCPEISTNCWEVTQPIEALK